METAGTLPDGRAVGRVRIESDNVSADLLTLGAGVQSVRAHGLEVVLGHPAIADYLESPFYLGATVGRFANRIGGGRFVLDGVTHRLPTNENGNTLHGGPDGYDRRLWNLTDATADSAAFALTSPDGDQGHPGRLEIRARYTASPGELRLVYTAETDAPTPVNLTNHIYFTADPEAGRTDDQLLTVHAARALETDAGLIPTGRLIDLTGAADLREGRPVAEAAPLDTCFVIDGGGQGRLVPHAALASPRMRIEVWSDQPGLQVFTADVLDVPGLSGRYGARAGVALETQNFPDAPNQPGFPDSILRPGQTYRAETRWRFTPQG